MPKRTCTKCKELKAAQAFFAGEEQCRACKRGDVAKETGGKPQGGVRKKPKAKPNGSTRTIREIAAKHAEPARRGGFRIAKGDVTICCDTAAEAAQLLQALSA